MGMDVGTEDAYMDDRQGILIDEIVHKENSFLIRSNLECSSVKFQQSKVRDQEEGA